MVTQTQPRTRTVGSQQVRPELQAPPIPPVSRITKKNEPNFEGLLTNGMRFTAEDMIDQTVHEYILQGVTLFEKDTDNILTQCTEMYVLKERVFYTLYFGQPINRDLDIVEGRQ